MMNKSEQTKLEKQSEKRLLEFLDRVIDQVRKAKTDYAAGRDLTWNFKQMELDLAGMANEIEGK